MNKTKRLTLASMFLTLGIILPQAFHMVPNAGAIFLPMHIPVLISGFVCGPLYGLLVGVFTPIISHIVFQMPLAPMLGQMIIELGIYGLVSGLLNYAFKIKNNIIKNYFVLILTMIIGRIVYGAANALVFKAGTYSLSTWLSAAFITALPGIMIQLIIIPIIVKALNKIIK